MPGTIKTNFKEQAPVLLVKPNGVTRPFGYGAATDSARGSALSSAIAASASGDLISFETGTFTLSSAISVPSGVSLIGQGYRSTKITLNAAGTAVSCGGTNSITGLSISNPHASGVAIGGSASDVTVLDCELTGGFDSANPSGAGPWQFIGCYFSDFAYDGMNTTATSTIVMNCTCIASPTNANETSFINAPSGSVLVANCDVNLSRASNEGALSFIRCGTAGSGVFTSKNNRVRINAGTQAAYGFSTFSFGIATFYSYDDQIDLTGSGSSYHFKAAVGGTTFNYRGGNVSSHNGTGTVNVLSQGGVSVSTLNGVTPGTTGLALLDDTSASAARDTLGASSGVFPVSVGGTGAGTLTGIVKGNGTSAMTAVTAPSGTIVGTSDSQTLTNKTLTSPVISGGTINNAIIGGTTAVAGTFEPLNVYSTGLGGSSTFTVDSSGTMTLTGAGDPQLIVDGELQATSFNVTTITSSAVSTGTLQTSGAVTFNDAGADVDFRVETDTDANMFQVDGGTNTVNISNASGFNPAQLNFGTGLGAKIALYSAASPYALGIQAFTFQFMCPSGATHFDFGTGVSGSQVVNHRLANDSSLDTCFNEQGADIDFRVEGDSLTHMIFVDASAATENIALVAGSAPNWQSMDRGLFIGNTTTAPTGNPSSGAFLWSDSGTLKTRTSGGAIRTLGADVQTIQLVPFTPVTSLSTGDGKAYFVVPAALNGGVITRVHARVITAGTTGTTDIQIANVTDAVDVLSTKLTIDSAETGSDTAAAAAVINTSNDDLATNDLLRIDIDAVSTTAPQGLIITIEVTL